LGIIYQAIELKGAIEFTQGAVVYIIIMIVVIVIGLTIFTGIHLMDIIKGKQVADMFEPGKMTFLGEEKNFFDAECMINPGSGGYVLSSLTAHVQAIDLLDSNKKEGNTVEFLILLDIGDRVYMGEADGNPVMTCTRASSEESFSCPKNSKIRFGSIQLDLSPSKNEYIHLSAWRSTAGLKNDVNSGAAYYKLIENQGALYLGSTGMKGIATFQGACAESICKACGTGLLNICDKAECKRLGDFCWFDAAGVSLFGWGGDCHACSPMTCKYMDRENCEICSKTCGWADGTCAAELLS
jgi:hypothetical protein